MWINVIYLIIALVFCLLKETYAECEFPRWLRDPLPDGSDRYWLTETQYIDNTELWETQLEIVVERRNIIAKLKYKAQCHDYTGTIPCYQREVQYRRFCLTYDGDNRYRVQHQGNGRHYYTCMKFIQRNKNVVQVWTADNSGENSEDLCREPRLKRSQWPWHAPEIEEWSFCPIAGGFDFRTFMYGRHSKLCHKEWKPSRLESECVKGDGLVFTFPEKTCSPFHDHRTTVNMQCWASWEEDDYYFILSAEAKMMPQYTLKFPMNYKNNREFNAELFFSPVCPLEPLTNEEKEDIDNIRVADLRVKPSEPGLCYDESDVCTEHALKGRCTSSALHEYANFCKRSCGLCELVPSTRAECRFPTGYRRDWFLWEKNRQETIRILQGKVSFTSLGQFVCKAKHWAVDYYKLLSYYTNGCRPRYTCIHFQHEDDDSKALQYQISKSSTVDHSFKLCKFEDDPEPLGGLIRSKNMKTLLRSSASTLRSCGLEGTVNVNVTIPGGSKCFGTLSDWDPFTCKSGPALTLRLPNCKHSPYVKEYTCAGYVNMDPGLSFLFTKDEAGDYSCWIIRTWPEQMSYKPWRKAYKLFRAQCGTAEDMDPNIHTVSEMSIHVGGDASKPCKKDLPDPNSGFPEPKSIRATSRGRSNQNSDRPQYRGTSGTNQCVSPRAHIYVLLTFIWLSSCFKDCCVTGLLRTL